MNQRIVDPAVYFKDNTFQEGRFISFEYVGKSFVMTAEYIGGKFNSSNVEFRLLNFKEVVEYNRQLGQHEALQDTAIDYFMEEHEGVHVIQDLSVKEENDKYHFDLWIDHSFGGISFSFTSLFEDRKVGIGRETPKKGFTYHDSRTGKEFSFYRPFGR